MPYYDYQCANDHRFELKQSFDAAPVATCPACSGEARRLINLVSVHYKGSGFYTTDYARKNGASEPARNGADSGAETKAESQPEAKAESKSETSGKEAVGTNAS